MGAKQLAGILARTTGAAPMDKLWQLHLSLGSAPGAQAPEPARDEGPEGMDRRTSRFPSRSCAWAPAAFNATPEAR